MTMTDPTIRDQAYQFFQQESVELLQVLEEGLLNIQVQYDTPDIHKLMRAAHSIKGGASSVDLPGIQKIAHKLEDIIRALYHREEPIDDDIEEALLQAYDCLRLPLTEQLEVGHYDEEEAWAKAEPIFTLLEAVLEKDLNAAEFELPTSAELGIDLISEVFSGDVRQAIERLEAIVQNPEGCEVTGEIRAMSEVLVGIGDLLDLSGLTAIAQTTLNALDSSPNQALDIAQATLDCLTASRAAVEAGDRSEGGSPSPALLALAESSTLPDQAITEMAPENGNGDLPTFAFEALVNESEISDPASSPEEIAPQMFDDIWGDQPPLEENLSEASEEEDLVEARSNLEDIFGAPEEEASVPVIEDIFGAPAEEVSIPVSISPELELVGVSEAPSIDKVEALEPSGLIPTVESTERPPTAAPKSEVAKAKTAKKERKNTNRTATPGQSVRVDFSRLERLNNLAGELVTQENGTLLQSQQIQKKLKALNQRFRNFEQLSKTLKEWMDKSIQSEGKHQNKQRQNTALKNNIDNLSDLSEFDPLQMDSYSEFYTVLQEALNEMAQMGENLGDMDLFFKDSQNIHRKKQQTLKQVRDDLLWARMIPLSDILNRFPRMVRDMATKHGKRTVYKQVGASTLVDKGMLEKLYDPLVHLVRNAFDHGTETPEERVAAGKPKQATIEVRAYHRGNQTFIEVRDDGRGIDPEVLRKAIVEKQLLDAEAAKDLQPEQLYPYIFQPNFSTAAQVSELSGRGMGLSAVYNQVQALKGSVRITSEIRQGTTFTISLPLTLTIAKLLVFTVDSRTIAIPVDTLQAIITTTDSEIKAIQGELFYRYQEKLVPLYPSSAFGYQYPLPKAPVTQEKSTAFLQDGKVQLLLISNGDNLLALEVDQIHDEQELAIKPFGNSATPPPYLFGCALIGDGTLVPVIDGAVILSKWNDASQTDNPTSLLSLSTPATTVKPMQLSVSTILVIDDSLTIRQNVTLTLQKYGYQVIQAGDGREALTALRQNPHINAVISDVEMPTMNGFEFLSACRKEYPADDLPIVMLTSRSSDKHRGIAKVLGANHYLTKPYLEQDLLASIKTLLEPIKC